MGVAVELKNFEQILCRL